MPRVFVVGCDESTGNRAELESREIEWNLPIRAKIGDLVLMYRSRPTSAIRDVWRVVGPFHIYEKGNKRHRPGRQGFLRRVVTLRKPLTYKSLASNPRTKDLPLLRRRLRGKCDITDDWHMIHDTLVADNPDARGRLRSWVYQ